MSDVLEIRVKKSHVAVLSVVILVASASAAVNVRDPMNVFGDLDMQGNEIQNTSKVELNPDYLKEIAKGGENDNKIEPFELLDAIERYRNGELAANKLSVALKYFQNNEPVTNADTDLKAAPMNSKGKIIATGAKLSNGENIQLNFTLDNNINMKSNKIQNAANYKFTPNYLRKYAKGGENDNKIEPSELLVAIQRYRNGEITENQIATAILYFKNNREVSSGLRAAPMTDNGKLAATGVKLQGTTQGEGIQPPNFTLSTDINMQGNNIYNAGNINEQTGGGSGGSTGIGEVDIIEEDGTLGPYKYCSIAKLEYPDDFQGGCTISRNSEGVWEKTTDANNFYECHAACFGLQTETATVTVDASPSSGNVQTIPLDQEYQNIIKAEWMGGGIQPEITPDGPKSKKTNWRISLHNSETNQRYEIARTGGRKVPGYTQPAMPPYFAEGRYRGTSLNPVTEYTDSYTARFPQVTADEVKLNVGGYDEFIFNGNNPDALYWSGFEDIKITYVPQN